MLPLATEENRRLLDQSQLANQQITKTVEEMRAQLQRAQIPFYARKNRRELACALEQITQQLLQQQQSQQQIQQLLTPSTCTASTLIYQQLEEHSMRPETAFTPANYSSSRQRAWSVSRLLPAYDQPPRIIGHKSSGNRNSASCFE